MKSGGIYFPESPDHLSNLCFFCFGLTNSGYCPNFQQKQVKQNDSDAFVAWETQTHMKTTWKAPVDKTRTD